MMKMRKKVSPVQPLQTKRNNKSKNNQKKEVKKDRRITKKVINHKLN